MARLVAGMVLAAAVIATTSGAVFAQEAPGEAPAGAPAEAPRGAKPSPEGARAYIIWPPDGAVIPGGRLWVRMGLNNMGVAPAGVDKPGTGHHHLIVDAELPPVGTEIPSDRNHLHFGQGQTEARLELTPGRHTIQMLVGDDKHIVHDPPVFSKRITITVPSPEDALSARRD